MEAKLEDSSCQKTGEKLPSIFKTFFNNKVTPQKILKNKIESFNLSRDKIGQYEQNGQNWTKLTKNKMNKIRQNGQKLGKKLDKINKNEQNDQKWIQWTK